MRKDRLTARVHRNSTGGRRAIERLESRTVLSAMPYASAPMSLVGKDGAINPPPAIAAGPHTGTDAERMNDIADHSGFLADNRSGVNLFASQPMGRGSEQLYYFTGPNQIFVVAGDGNQFEVVQVLMINNDANYGSPYGANAPSIATDSARPEYAPPSAPAEYLAAPSADPGSHGSTTRSGDPSANANLRSVMAGPTSTTSGANNQTVFATAHVNSNSAAAASMQTVLAQSRTLSNLQDRLAVHSANTTDSVQALPAIAELKAINAAATQNDSRSDHHPVQIVRTNITSTSDVAALPTAKASLLGAFDLPAVHRAVQAIMIEVETIGTKVSTWLDEAHLLPLAGAVAIATMGAGAAYYVRRSRSETAGRWEDEPSSSWLFLRLQPHPGE